MKILFPFIVLALFISCKEANKVVSEIAEETSIDNTSQHPGKALMESNCYSCHNPSSKQGNRIAPPMIAVKEHYMNANTTKEIFIEDIVAWTKKPSVKKSKMPGAIRRFGVMPYLPYPEKDIKAIADYMFTYDIDQPDWFEKHQRQESIIADKNKKSIDEIGLEYAIATKQLLGKNLMKAIQEKGTLGALEFCNIQAYPLTDSMATNYNAQIKRVSDKPRNPNNQANTEELAHIKSFKKDIAADIEPKPIVRKDGNMVEFYYPITTNTMCLQCHGTDKEVSPETFMAIKNLYPNDKALGYTENEVRGIWSIQFDTQD